MWLQVPSTPVAIWSGAPHLTISGRANEQSPTFGGANAETISEALTLGHDVADAETLGGGAARRAGS